MKSKPFAILGVNSDRKEKLKSIIENETVTWKCWFDGGDAKGPIASKWNVQGWPTIYVIDKKGIIRAKDHGLDMVILNKLLSTP